MPRPPKAKSTAKHYAVHLGVEFGFGPESAVFVLVNGSMSSNQSGEGDIRRALIEADFVDTASRDSAFIRSEATPQVLLRSREANEAQNNMVALPGQLFYSTQIPAYLWFSGKNNTLDSANDARLFDGETELSLVA